MRDFFKNSFFQIISVFLLTFCFFYLCVEKHLPLDIFTARDILRALGWLEGSPYWPGPDMSAGNHLPGPFFYFLLFPPLLFGGSIYSHSVLWLVSWFALTYTVAFYFTTKIVEHKESRLIFFSVLIAAVGQTIFAPLQFAWNSGFSIIFHILALMNIYSWRQSNNSLYLYILGFVIAFGIQVHFLLCVHIITVLLFMMFNLKKINPLTVCLFLFISFFPFLLYHLFEYFNFFEASSGFYIEHLRFLKKEMFGEKWIKNIKNVLNLSYIIPLGFYLLLSLWKKIIHRKWLVKKSTIDLFIMVAVPIFIAIPSARMPWYTHFIPVFLILFLTKLCDDLMPVKRNKMAGFFLIYGLLLICSLVPFKNLLFFFSVKHLYFLGNNYHIFSLFSMSLIFLLLIVSLMVFIPWIKKDQKNLWKMNLFLFLMCFVGYVKIINYFSGSGKRSHVPESFSRTWASHQALYPILGRIFLETNWPTKEVVKRIHSIGIWAEISLPMNYSLTIEKIKKTRGNKLSLDLKELSERPTGYMIIQHIKNFIGYSEGDWYQYLSSSGLLSDFLRQEIREGKVLIQTPQLYGKYWLIPYNTTKESAFIGGFYNTGQPYYWEEPEWLRGCKMTQSFENEHGYYYCMVMPDFLSRAGVHIDIYTKINSATHSRKTFMDVTFWGSLIGVGENSSNQTGHALWSDIQVSLLCNMKEVKYTLPPMGMDFFLQKKDATERGKNFSSPLTLRFSLSLECDERENISKIKLTFDHLFFNYWFTNMADKQKKTIIWED